jgi:hypothetical protein
MANQNQTNFLIKPDIDRKSTFAEETEQEKKIFEKIVDEKTIIVNKRKPKLKDFEVIQEETNQVEKTKEMKEIQESKTEKKEPQADLETQKIKNLFEFDITKEEPLHKNDSKVKNLFYFNNNEDNLITQPLKKEKKEIKQEKIKFIFDDE